MSLLNYLPRDLTKELASYSSSNNIIKLCMVSDSARYLCQNWKQLFVTLFPDVNRELIRYTDVNKLTETDYQTIINSLDSLSNINSDKNLSDCIFDDDFPCVIYIMQHKTPSSINIENFRSMLWADIKYKSRKISTNMIKLLASYLDRFDSTNESGKFLFTYGLAKIIEDSIPGGVLGPKDVEIVLYMISLAKQGIFDLGFSNLGFNSMNDLLIFEKSISDYGQGLRGLFH